MSTVIKRICDDDDDDSTRKLLAVEKNEKQNTVFKKLGYMAKVNLILLATGNKLGVAVQVHACVDC